MAAAPRLRHRAGGADFGRDRRRRGGAGDGAAIGVDNRGSIVTAGVKSIGVFAQKQKVT
jgi:hypothetical protein